jgi:hypothetical protein
MSLKNLGVGQHLPADELDFCLEQFLVLHVDFFFNDVSASGYEQGKQGEPYSAAQNPLS